MPEDERSSNRDRAVERKPQENPGNQAKSLRKPASQPKDAVSLSAMFDEDEDQGFMLLVLGVLAAVLMTVLWTVISDDAPAPAPVAVAVAEPTEAPAPTPAPTAVPTEVEAAAPAPAAEPIILDVNVDNNVAVLSGTLDSEDTRQSLLAAAATLPDITEVVDNTELDSSRTPELLISSLSGTASSEAQAADLRLFASRLGDADPFTDALNVDEPAPEPTPEPEPERVPTLAESLNGIFLFEKIQFASGSAVIDAASEAQLDEAAEVIIGNPDGGDVTVEGHTDSAGDEGANQTLSQARADAVVAYLTNAGVDADRLSAVGFGQSSPIADNDTPEGRAENRRIEFALADG